MIDSPTCFTRGSAGRALLRRWPDRSRHASACSRDQVMIADAPGRYCAKPLFIKALTCLKLPGCDWRFLPERADPRRRDGVIDFSALYEASHPDLRDENQKRHLGFSSPICEHRKARKNSILKQWFLSQTLGPAGTLFRRRHILSPPLAPASRRYPDCLSGHGIPGSWARSRYGNGNR